MTGKRMLLPFTAGPLAMPPIRLRPGEPTLAQEREQPVCLPQSTQMPDTRPGDSMWPFLRRVGESCLFGAEAMPPVLSDLIWKDNTGAAPARLTGDGREPSRSGKQ